MDTDYIEYILEHYKNPRNYGIMNSPDISHELGNPICDDVIRIDLRVSDNVVSDAKFSGKGCAISQASASILTDMIIGKKLDYIKDMNTEDIAGVLGIKITSIRIECALLALKALKAGIYKFDRTHPRDESRAHP